MVLTIGAFHSCHCHPYRNKKNPKASAAYLQPCTGSPHSCCWHAQNLHTPQRLLTLHHVFMTNAIATADPIINWKYLLIWLQTKAAPNHLPSRSHCLCLSRNSHRRRHSTHPCTLHGVLHGPHGTALEKLQKSEYHKLSVSTRDHDGHTLTTVPPHWLSTV